MQKINGNEAHVNAWRQGEKVDEKKVEIFAGTFDRTKRCLGHS